MFAFIAALHIIGWGTLVFLVAPQHFSLGDKVFGVGVGLTAYTLGVRHAFDADHIAAIDNTTRKLMGEGQRPLSVGFWFSLGHSTVVFGLALLLALGVRALAGPVEDDASALHQTPGLIGTSVSGHLPVPDRRSSTWSSSSASSGVPRDAPRRATTRPSSRRSSTTAGFMNRLLGRVTRAVTQAVAHVPGRPAVRPRLRHRHRGRAAGAGRRARPRSGCPGTRSCACRCCSPPG